MAKSATRRYVRDPLSKARAGRHVERQLGRRPPSRFNAPAGVQHAGAFAANTSSPRQARRPGGPAGRRIAIPGQGLADKARAINQKLQELFGEFKEQREGIWILLEKHSDLLSADTLCALADSQREMVQHPEKITDFIEAPSLGLADTEEELRSVKEDLDRIGALNLAAVKGESSAYSLADQARILDRTLSMKLIAELCAHAAADRLGEAGIQVKKFNTFDPPMEALLSAVEDICLQAQAVYRVGSYGSTVQIAAPLDRCFVHMMQALDLLDHNVPHWERLVSFAAKVLLPDSDRPRGKESTDSDNSTQTGSDVADLAELESDAEERAPLATLAELKLEDAQEEALLALLAQDKPSMGLDRTGIQMPFENPDLSYRLLTAPGAGMSNALLKVEAQLARLSKASRQTTAQSYEKLDVLMGLARNLRILKAPGKSSAEIQLQGLVSLKQLDKDMSSSDAQLWSHFLCHLSSALFPPMVAHQDEEPDAENVDLTAAARVLGRSLDDLQGEANLYSRVMAAQGANMRSRNDAGTSVPDPAQTAALPDSPVKRQRLLQ